LIVFLIWKPSLSLSPNIEGMNHFKITVDREKQTGIYLRLMYNEQGPHGPCSLIIFNWLSSIFLPLMSESHPSWDRFRFHI
jgi:hypothetical protein